MEKRRMLFIVWVVAMLCLCWAVDNFSMYQEDDKDSASNARDSISSTAYGAQREASRMANMASDNAENFFYEKANQAMDAAAKMAHRATEGGIHSSSDVCDFASEKADNVNNKAEEKAHDAYDSASDKAGRAMNTACDREADAKEGAKHKPSEAYDFASQKVDDGMNTASTSTRAALAKENDEVCEYEDAKSKVYEAYKYAKDTMTEQAKEKYEAAKEKASDAAGNLGQKMRTGKAEL